jgi:predicted thioesterase
MMDPQLITPGLQEETTFTVEEQNTASQIGSGSLKVLATPYLIGVIEKTCHQLLAKKLPEGYSSVGSEIHLKHLAPTPIGSKVKVTARVFQVDANRISFSVCAYDEMEKIAEGQHTRVIIEIARFLKRVVSKQNQRN